MELLNFENLDLDNNNVEVLFDGLFTQGFYVETEFDYMDQEDGEGNIEPYAITFWDFKIFKFDGELITINERETKKIKQMIEFKLIDSLTDYLNNN